MMNLQDFYFIRHGETDWNREHRGMGQKNIPLNHRGLKQAHLAARILENEKIGTICHSPLLRAKVTAEIIGNHLNLPLVEIPGLIECCWGEKEGSVKGQWTDDWVKGLEIPGAETYRDFLIRSADAINESLLQKGPILIVSHGGVFWTIQHFGRLGSKIDLPNGIPIYMRAPVNPSSGWSFSPIDEVLE